MADFTLKIEAPDLVKLAEAILDLSVAVRNQGQPAKAGKGTPLRAVAPQAEKPAPVAAPETPVDERESSVEPAPKAAEPTINDVRDALRAFMARAATPEEGKKRALELLGRYGAASVPAVPAAKYAEVIAEANAK